jgi:transposase
MQSFSMPPDVRDWLPENHLAWFVIGAVAEINLDAFFAAYRVDGRSRPPYDPAMMVALLLYAYARGIRSSRIVEVQPQREQQVTGAVDRADDRSRTRRRAAERLDLHAAALAVDQVVPGERLLSFWADNAPSPASRPDAGRETPAADIERRRAKHTCLTEPREVAKLANDTCLTATFDQCELMAGATGAIVAADTCLRQQPHTCF